jgi:Fur family ferric uptake transcriptional regulator
MGVFHAGSRAMSKTLKEMDVLRQHLAKHQLKLTRQRELILTAFLRQEHVTAETMYHQLAKKMWNLYRVPI